MLIVIESFPNTLLTVIASKPASDFEKDTKFSMTRETRGSSSPREEEMRTVCWPKERGEFPSSIRNSRLSLELEEARVSRTEGGGEPETWNVS